MKNDDLHIKLNDGLLIPKIGFGTAQLRGNSGLEAITGALNNGYRFLDSAFNYDNEGTVGQAIVNSEISRDEIVVSSKLPGRFHGYKDALRAIQESLFRMNLDYIDLYLIHWPNPMNHQYVEAWKALIEAKKLGYVRSIGVSNFLPEYIDDLIETGVTPSVNEIQVYPYFNSHSVHMYNQSHKITTIAWSPLGRSGLIFDDDKLKEIARKHHRNIAQIVLRWETQQNIIPIPRSQDKEHQLDNLNIFDFNLNQDEINLINGLTRDDGRSSDQDPKTHEQH